MIRIALIAAAVVYVALVAVELRGDRPLRSG